MKILSVTAQKPHSTGSGVYLTELVKGFETLGYKQAVVAGVYQDDKVVFPEGISFYPVYYKTEELPFPIAGMSDEMPYESIRYSQMTEVMVKAFEKAFTEEIRKAVDELSPDVILCHHLYLLTAIVRRYFPDRKVMAVCHGTGLRQMKKNSLRRREIREQIRKLDLVFSLHEAQKKEITEEYGVDPQKTVVIGSGYNESVFKPVSVRRKDKVILIFAGKLSEKKGVMSLIKSLSYLKEREDRVELWLAGGYGNQEEYDIIKALAQACKYSVRFLGRLEQTELAEKFSQAAIFVLPSFYEGLPLVVIEALACGLSVVCSDIPGIRPWIESQIGECPVEYVKLPTIQNADEPVEDELPGFELRLAKAIEKRIGFFERGEGVCQVDFSRVTWPGICRLIAEKISKEEEIQMHSGTEGKLW